MLTPLGDHLNELDGFLGDGDLGVTIVNGFRNMATVADDLPDDFCKVCIGCTRHCCDL